MPMTTVKGAAGKGTDHHQRGAQLIAADVDEAPEEEEENEEEEEAEEEEVFSQARDTVASGSEPDEAVERADHDGRREADALLSPASPPVLGGPSSGSLRPGRKTERQGKSENGEDEKEWCAGHVCLRLRPDGLRERRSRSGGDGGGGGGARREPGGNNAGDDAEEASESDDDSVSPSDDEVHALFTRRHLTIAPPTSIPIDRSAEILECQGWDAIQGRGFGLVKSIGHCVMPYKIAELLQVLLRRLFYFRGPYYFPSPHTGPGRAERHRRGGGSEQQRAHNVCDRSMGRGGWT